MRFHSKAVLKHTHSKRFALPNTLVPGQLPCEVHFLAGLTSDLTRSPRCRQGETQSQFLLLILLLLLIPAAEQEQEQDQEQEGGK